MHAHVDLDVDVSFYVDVSVCANVYASAYIILSLHVLRQFHRLHFAQGRMINKTAINVVLVLKEACTGRSPCPNADDSFDGCATYFKHDLHNATCHTTSYTTCHTTCHTHSAAHVTHNMHEHTPFSRQICIAVTGTIFSRVCN